MTLRSLRPHLLLLGAASLLSSTALAQSVDGNAFAERLQAVSASQGSPLRYESVASEGSTVILSGVRIGEAETEVPLGTVRFEEVSGSNAEGWRAERVPFENVASRQDDVETRVEGALLEGLTLEPESPEPSITALNFERMAVQSLAVDRAGEEAFRMDGFSLTNAPGESESYEVELAVESFVVDGSATGGQEGPTALEEIGYEQLRGNMTGSGLWNTQTGELTLSPLLVRLEEAGELSLAYSIAGYTPAFVQALTSAQQQMAANPDNPGAGIAMMGLMAQLTVNSAEIVFRDQSLTNRLLDYYAGENNQTREELIDSLVGALPLALGYLNNPQFQSEVTEAVQTFLRNPGVMTVAVAPAQPIPASQIIGAALGAPQTLPAVLNLSVAAND